MEYQEAPFNEGTILTIYAIFDCAARSCRMRENALKIMREHGVGKAREWLIQSGANAELLGQWQWPEDGVTNPMIILRRKS